jgi:hypothetical protein
MPAGQPRELYAAPQPPSAVGSSRGPRCPGGMATGKTTAGLATVAAEAYEAVEGDET